VRLALLLLRLCAHPSQRPQITGDLIEEYAGNTRWMLSQTLRSAPSLLWMRVRKEHWVRAFGAALAGYLLMMFLTGFMSGFLWTGSDRRMIVVSLAAALPTSMAGGFLAAWIHTRGSHVLVWLTGLMGVVSLIVTGQAAPISYQIGMTALASVGCLLGGRLQRRIR
jgi:hypothetical protein